jgi:hypothetical protein
VADIGPLGRPLVAADSYPSTCCRSSVVEHSIGNGEVDSSILSGSTIPWINHAQISSLRHQTPEFCFFPEPSSVKRAQGRPGAGWHPRTMVVSMRRGCATGLRLRAVSRWLSHERQDTKTEKCLHQNRFLKTIHAKCSGLGC